MMLNCKKFYKYLDHNSIKTYCYEIFQMYRIFGENLKIRKILDPKPSALERYILQLTELGLLHFLIRHGGQKLDFVFDQCSAQS